jgi:hypothetical protein
VRRAGLAATDQLERVARQQDLHWHGSDSAVCRLELVGLSGTSGERTAYDALANCLASRMRRRCYPPSNAQVA